MKIDAETYHKLPERLKALFQQAPNHSRDDVIGAFPVTKSGKDKTESPTASRSGFTGNGIRNPESNYGDEGCAARFFYAAKASRKDRNEGLEGRVPTYVGRHAGSRGQESYQINPHPTVKPTDLMRYLCRLVTPPSGVILDPFMGSGSTGKAAVAEGFKFIGIEMVEEYFAIAHERITGEPYIEDLI